MLEKVTKLVNALRGLVDSLGRRDPWPVIALVLSVTVLLLVAKS